MSVVSVSGGAVGSNVTSSLSLLASGCLNTRLGDRLREGNEMRIEG